MVVSLVVILALALALCGSATVAPSRKPTAKPTTIPSSVISLCPFHVNIDATIAHNAAPYTIPSTHPSVQPMLKPHMPRDHPNVDTLLKNRKKYPSDHPYPAVNPYTSRVPPTQQCMEFTGYVPASVAGCNITVYAGHPSVNASVNSGTQLPAGHPLTDPLLRPYLPASHPNIDSLIAAKTPLPMGHPSVDPYLCAVPYVTPSTCVVNVTQGHPSVNASVNNGTPLPAGHPLTDPLLRRYLPPGHGNLDTLIAAKTPLPVGHPSVDPFLCKVPYVDPSSCSIEVYVGHPSVDGSVKNGTSLPAGHPLTDPLLRPYMPLGHGNTDELLAAKTPLPDGHPSIDPYLCVVTFPSASAIKKSRKPYIPHGHPNVDQAIAEGSQCPFAHPKMDPLLRPILPKSHGNCDKYVEDGTPLPSSHPLIQPYLYEGGRYTAGFLMSCIAILGFVLGVMIRCVKLATTQSYNYPKTQFNSRIADEGVAEIQMAVVASSNPPTVTAKKSEGGEFTAVPTSDHLSVVGVSGSSARKAERPPAPTNNKPTESAQPNAASSEAHHHQLIPQSEDEAADLQSPPSFPPPSKSSPKPSSVSKRKVADIESGLNTFSYERVNNKTDRSWEQVDADTNKEQPSVIMCAIRENARVRQESFQNEHDGSVDTSVNLPRRDQALQEMIRLNSAHRTEMYDYGAYDSMPIPSSGRVEVAPEVLASLPAAEKKRVSMRLGVSEEAFAANASRLRGKSNSMWARIHAVLTTTRVPYFEWPLENVLVFFVYLAMNVLCVLFAPRQQYGRSLGSLAAFNTALLIVPATRNNILTLGLALPFDHVIVYHRFFGRFTILCVVSHFYFFAFSYTTEPFIYLTGLGAMLCSFVILLSSMDYIRRKYFNVFYYSHYAFVGYLVLAYLHVSGTRPYILIGTGLYLADKLLRMLWMLWPRTMTVFANKGDSIAHVRFHKNPLTKWMDMHRVGQYYFVNFPALSLHEWHPFSVSSGPREDEVELHIRALGDHTKEIVKLATERGGKVPTWICIDGPYGVQSFDYRRYPMLLLAGGGIGITPVMGMVKDIYDVGLPPCQHFHVSHAIETVYLIWVMPHIADYESFRDDLQTCVVRSHAPDRPKLVLSIYITRSKEDLEPPLISGRPQFAQVFTNMMDSHPHKPGLVFACGPAPMVTELWDQSIQSTIKGRLIDFHHEIFEF